MINLLPPDIKQQIIYSKRNAILMRYIIWAVIVAILASLGIAYGTYYLNNQISVADNQIAENNRLVEKDGEVVEQAKQVNARIASIQKIQDNQARFSQLLTDIASVLPRGSAIESMSLDGDDKKPVRITGSAQSYEIAAVVASNIAKSPRVSESRTERIEQSKEKRNYQFTITITFKPGQSR